MPDSLQDVFKPEAPIMGGLEQSRYNEWCAWTGGKPKRDWSGLDDQALQKPKCGLQVRSLQDKKYIYRVTGLEAKLSKSNKTTDITRFFDDVIQHLDKHGMDTISYVPDPLDPSGMRRILEDYPRYTTDKIRQLMAPQLQYYDKYDLANDDAARDFLLDSLEPTFRRELKDISKKVQSFPELVMILVRLITDDSPAHWETVKSELRSIIPQNYAGHDICALTNNFVNVAAPLEAAGYYDHTLTTALLRNVLKAAWPPQSQFRVLTLHEKVEDGVQHIRFMEKSAADEYMSANRLTYTLVCEKLAEEYLTCHKQATWEAAQNVTDSKAPPEQYGANNTSVQPTKKTPKSRASLPSRKRHAQTYTVDQVHALVQSMSTGSGSNTTKPGTCHNCGKPGHWKSDCPLLRRTQRDFARGDGKNHHAPRTDTPFPSTRSNSSNSRSRVSFHSSKSSHGRNNTHTSHHSNHSNFRSHRPPRHTHSTPSRNPSTVPHRANVALQIDPSAWHVHVSAHPHSDDSALQSTSCHSAELQMDLESAASSSDMFASSGSSTIHTFDADTHSSCNNHLTVAHILPDYENIKNIFSEWDELCMCLNEPPQHGYDLGFIEGHTWENCEEEITGAALNIFDNESVSLMSQSTFKEYSMMAMLDDPEAPQPTDANATDFLTSIDLFSYEADDENTISTTDDPESFSSSPISQEHSCASMNLQKQKAKQYAQDSVASGATTNTSNSFLATFI